jgi:transposase
VKRRKGRRNLANFENLPVTTCVHELSEAERACPCCGIERKEIGTDQSWQVEYLPGHFERIHHLRKKYACPGCESNGNNPQMETAAKPETAIDKGMAGPGLLAYIVTSKFADYLPLYRLEDIFQRQGFEISLATQSVWCGDIADLAEPLYELMAERVRASHVVATDDTIMPMLSKGKTANARMWVYVGDDHLVPIPKFPTSKQEEIAKLYHNPTAPPKSALTASNVLDWHREWNNQLGIWELDREMKALQRTLRTIQQNIIDGKPVDPSCSASYSPY